MSPRKVSKKPRPPTQHQRQQAQRIAHARNFQLLVPGYRLRWEKDRDTPIILQRPPMLGSVARIVGDIK